MAVRTFVPVRDEAADRELLRRIPDRHVQPIDLDVALVHHRSPCHVLLDLSPRPAHTGPLHQPIPHATPVPCRAYSSRLGHRCQTYPTATTHLVVEGLRVDLMDTRRQGDAELDLLGPSWNGLALGLQRGGAQREGMEVSGEQERGAAAPQRRSRGPASVGPEGKGRGLGGGERTSCSVETGRLSRGAAALSDGTAFLSSVSCAVQTQFW